MKILFVGQAPGRRAPRGTRAFGGLGAGSRLAKLCGLTHEQFLERFETVNVFKTWRGKSGKGDAFPRKAAVAKAEEIKGSIAYRRADVVVFVGAGVCRAFHHYTRLARVLINEPCTIHAFVMHGKARAYLPHPSGINHWYNDPTNRATAQAFLRRLVKEAQR